MSLEVAVSDMTIEMVVGLNVVDDDAYQAYREEITPMLEKCGGGFGYDFKILKVLKSATQAPINRVFVIYFPDRNLMNTFFSDQAYLEIKQRYFEDSVTDTTIIATYER